MNIFQRLFNKFFSKQEQPVAVATTPPSPGAVFTPPPEAVKKESVPVAPVAPAPPTVTMVYDGVYTDGLHGYWVEGRSGTFYQDKDTAIAVRNRDKALDGYKPVSSGLVTPEFLNDPMYAAFKMAAAQSSAVAYLWILNHTPWYQANSLRIRENYFNGDNEAMSRFLQEGEQTQNQSSTNQGDKG